MANRKKLEKQITRGVRLSLMAASVHSWCQDGRCFFQAQDVILYGAPYTAIQGQGDTLKEAEAEFWLRVAKSKDYADRYANNAGPAVNDTDGA